MGSASGAGTGGRFAHRHGRVMRCVVATAERGSSLSPDGMAEAASALRSLDADVGAVLVTGEGANFCTGGDVRAFASVDDPAELVRGLAEAFHELQRAVIGAPVPVVVAAHGWAAGAGMSLVLAGDIVIAGRSTRLRPAYPAIGFSPDGGMSWMLPRIVGAARARHILLTDRVIGPDEAMAWGLVSEVVADEDVLAHAERIAQRLAEGPTGALGRIKKLLHDGLDRDLDTHLDAEAKAIGECAGSAEGRAGVARFIARRAT